MKKGQIVKCVKCTDGEFTVGKEYKVLAGRGDIDTVLSGTVEYGGTILKKDDGNDAYCYFPSCLYGDWEVVS